VIKIRLLYTFLTIGTIAIAPFLLSKWSSLPNWVNFWLGDFLFGILLFWATMIFFAHANKQKIALFLVIYCSVVELSQLYHAAWLDALRQTTIGGGILGHHFQWPDLLAYIGGVLFAYLIDKQCFT
jgi:hypothetical protein